MSEQIPTKLKQIDATLSMIESSLCHNNPNDNLELIAEKLDNIGSNLFLVAEQLSLLTSIIDRKM